MTIVVTIMKKHELQPSEIVELLTPLIDFKMMKKCSVSALKDNPEGFAKKIETEGKPIALTHNGKRIALLCDPTVYKQTERKRLRLEELLVGISLETTPAEFVPTVGRRPMLASEHQNLWKLKEYIYKIEKLQSQINLLKCNLYEKEEQLQETTEKERELMPAIKPVSLASREKTANL